MHVFVAQICESGSSTLDQVHTSQSAIDGKVCRQYVYPTGQSNKKIQYIHKCTIVPNMMHCHTHACTIYNVHIHVYRMY